MPRDIMGKMVGFALMMSYIPPSEPEVFRTAVQALIAEFKSHLTENIIKQYLNGNPKDLGGRCAGPAGTVASNQGGERRGGWLKNGLAKILKFYGITTTVNPVYFLIAAAKDTEFYFPNGANCIATKPNRALVEQDAFKSLSALANHNASRGNFSSDFLYSICTIKDATGHGNEVPLHTVLGKKNTHFTVFIPSIATQLNTLKRMLLADADGRSSGPMAFMQHCPSLSQVSQITSNPTNCYNHLS